MRNRIFYLWDFLTAPHFSRTLSILVILIIAAAVPFTVLIGKQQQNLRQKAAGGCPTFGDGSAAPCMWFDAGDGTQIGKIGNDFTIFTTSNTGYQTPSIKFGPNNPSNLQPLANATDYFPGSACGHTEYQHCWKFVISGSLLTQAGQHDATLYDDNNAAQVAQGFSVQSTAPTATPTTAQTACSAYTINGHVTIQNGQPAQGATICLDPSADGTSCPSSNPKAVTNTQGNYSINVPSGYDTGNTNGHTLYALKGNITIPKTGGGTIPAVITNGNATDNNLSADQLCKNVTNANLNIAVETVSTCPTYTISGHVQAQNGRSVIGATICLDPSADGTSCPSSNPKAVTNTQGNYSINVPSGYDEGNNVGHTIYALKTTISVPKADGNGTITGTITNGNSLNDNITKDQVCKTISGQTINVDIQLNEPTTPTTSPTATPTVTQAPSPSASPTEPPSTTPSVSPSPSVSPTTTPTDTPVPGSTILNIALNLQKVGKNAGENNNPKHPERNLTITLFNKDRTIEKTDKKIKYNNQTGLFETTIDMGVIPAGNYLVKIKTQRYLSKLLGNIITVQPGGGTITINLIQNPQQLPLFIIGDANDDNALDIRDWNIIKACFDSFRPMSDKLSKFNSESCQAFPTRELADLNDDDSISQEDHTLFLINLNNRQGD